MHLKDIQSIHRPYDHVYISPHFDDVAASCSGKILQQRGRKESVLVVTAFTAPAGSKPTHINSSLTSMLDYDARRQEDLRAMQILDADCLWLEYPEILFRDPNPWHRYAPNIRTTPDAHQLCRELALKLEHVCRTTACADLTLPLGVGQHMDHQILFEAGIQLLDTADRSYDVRFYEELPYALFSALLEYRLKKTGVGSSGIRSGYRTRMARQYLPVKQQVRLLFEFPSLGMHRALLKPWVFLGVLCLEALARCFVKPEQDFFRNGRCVAEIQDITPFIDSKLDTICAYSSQLSGLMASRTVIKKGLAAHAHTLGMAQGCFGERYWHVIW